MRLTQILAVTLLISCNSINAQTSVIGGVVGTVTGILGNVTSVLTGNGGTAPPSGPQAGPPGSAPEPILNPIIPSQGYNPPPAYDPRNPAQNIPTYSELPEYAGQTNTNESGCDTPAPTVCENEIPTPAPTVCESESSTTTGTSASTTSLVNSKSDASIMQHSISAAVIGAAAYIAVPFVV